LIALVVGIGFGVVIGIATLTVARPVFQSKEWAAWVQAFGSIAAIGGAYWIGKQQARFAENLRIERTKKAILGIGDLALERANLIAALLSLNEDRLSDHDMVLARVRLLSQYHKSMSDGVIGAIESIPFAEVGSAKAIAALQGLQLQFGFLDQAITNFNRGPEKIEVFSESLKQYLPGSSEYISHKEILQETLRFHVHDRIKHIKRHYNDLVQSL
jgi:hypothetical protein